MTGVMHMLYECHPGVWIFIVVLGYHGNLCEGIGSTGREGWKAVGDRWGAINFRGIQEVKDYLWCNVYDFKNSFLIKYIIIYIFLFFNFILFLNFTILYWFCQISKWIRHRYTRVPHPGPSSLLPPHTIPLGRPSAPLINISVVLSYSAKIMI